MMVFKRQHTATSSYNISTPLTITYSSLLRNLTQIYIYTFSGQFSFIWTQQYTSHYSLRKPTHTDQCLHWNSHNSLSAKYSVFNILTCSSRTVCANPQLPHKEEEHIIGCSQRCQFPNWALTRLKMKSNHKHNTTQVHNNNHKTCIWWYPTQRV